MECVELLPGLYQGSAFAAAAELPAEIEAVLNVTPEPDPAVPRLRASLWCPLPEGKVPSIGWLDAVTAFVAGSRAEGWGVLVHCSYGVTRSSLVTAAYLMRVRGWCRDMAVAYLRGRGRPVQLPLGYAVLLDEWERYLRRKAA